MIRIVGVQRGETAGSEYVLLQNQGSMRVPLRGHVLMSEAFLHGLCPVAYVALTEQETIGPGHFVVVGTGTGHTRWTVMDEGRYALRLFLGRTEPLWSEFAGPIHILNVQHSYEERDVPHLTVSR